MPSNRKPLAVDSPPDQPGCTDTRVVKRLKPSQAGAIKLSRRYGNALVCVRYRRNAQGTHRYTTVELVVDTAPVVRRVPPRGPIVMVRLAFDDAEGRRRALARGAEWHADTALWSMTRAAAESLGWLGRVVPAPFAASGA